MAFNPQELEIIRAGKEGGKSVDEIRGALTRYRTGMGPVPQAPAPTPNSGYANAVSEAAQAGVQKVQRGISDIVTAPDAISKAEGALRAGAGAVETATAPLAPVFSPLGKIIGYVADKLAETTPFKEAFAPSRVIQPDGTTRYETTNDDPILAERLAEGVSNASTIIGAAGGAVGLAGAARSAITRASAALEGITEVGEAGITAAKAQAKAPAQLMQRVARISKQKQIAFKEQAGVDVGQYLVDRGIFGTPDVIVEQLYKRFDQSKSSVDSALDKLPGTYKAPAIGTALKQLLEREQRTSSPGAISRDLERVRELQRRFKGQGLSMAEINEVKRLYERNVRMEYIKENVPDKVQQATNIDSAVRTWQAVQAERLGFKNLRQLNKETQLAKQLMDDLGAEYAGQQGNNAVSLTDWIVLAGGDPSAIGMFLTKKAATSKTIMSKTAELMSDDATVPLPQAEMGAPTIDGYLRFLEKTGGVN